MILKILLISVLGFGYTDKELLDKVNESPKNVGAHNKSGWVGLFGQSGIVEDPVGTQVYYAQNTPTISQFYDAFIQPNQIHFEIEYDIVSDMNVVRKAVVVSKTPSGFVIRVPAYLLYQLHDENQSLQVKRMAAHWEMGQLTKSVVGKDGGLPSVKDQAVWLFKTLGGYGSVKYFTQGLAFGVFGRGKRVASSLSYNLEFGRERKFLKAFKSDASISLPGGKTISPSEFFQEFKGTKFEILNPISSGYTTSFEYTASREGHTGKGIGILHFTKFSQKIEKLEIFY